MRLASCALTRAALIVLVTLAPACHQQSGGPYRAPDDSNLILISIDTLSADHMSLYGYSRLTTPFLDRRAKEAITFDRFYHSGGGTLPSHLSMMTSLHPLTHNIHPKNIRTLEDERITLAEQLKEAGFSTAAFTDGGWVAGKFGFNQGFDIYDDEGKRLAETLPKARKWLREHHKERFFLFLHTYDTHSSWKKLPYECPDTELLDLYAAEYGVDFDGCRDERCASKLLAWLNRQVRDGQLTVEEYFSDDELAFVNALYDGCINYVDNKLQEFFAELKELGLYDKSMIVITSDHGEEFAEHGQMLHDQGGYEELSRIPLIIKLPHSALSGRRISQLGTMVDLMPTILEILGLPVNQQAQGFSLVPAITNDLPVREDIHMYSVLWTGRWKYFSRQKELYDNGSDPLEQHNLYEQHPELVQQLDQRVRSLIKIDRECRDSFLAAVEQGDLQELDEEEIENLKALGYLED